MGSGRKVKLLQAASGWRFVYVSVAEQDREPWGYGVQLAVVSPPWCAAWGCYTLISYSFAASKKARNGGKQWDLGAFLKASCRGAGIFPRNTLLGLGRLGEPEVGGDRC